jgi:hypothetical protein
MEQVVRKPVVVADRAAPEIGKAVAADLDPVPPLVLLDERDLHWSDLRTKNLYCRPSKVVSPLGVNPSFSRLRKAAELSGYVMAVTRSNPVAKASRTIASDASVA